jgi:hypothetical protein
MSLDGSSMILASSLPDLRINALNSSFVRLSQQSRNPFSTTQTFSYKVDHIFLELSAWVSMAPGGWLCIPVKHLEPNTYCRNP